MAMHTHVFGLAAPLVIAAAAWAQSGSISSGFGGGNTVSPPNAGLYFDFTARQDLRVDSFEININADAGTPVTVQAWYKEGSFVGFETDPGPWIMLGETTVNAEGRGVPTPVPIGGLQAEAGQTYGMIVFHVDAFSPRYYNANDTNAMPIYSNADAQIDIGQGCISTQTPFRACSFRPRGWNGTIHYTLGATICYPDCDNNEVLDFFDFLCFQNAFLAGDPYADCDGNTVLDFFDFLCFQNEFLAGC